MGTRSYVGMMVGDKCRAVYIHFDGYLEGVGADLQAYTTQAAVEELINQGDRSTLTLGDSYLEQGDEAEDVAAREYATFEEFFDACYASWGEWYYIFKDGVWYCGNTYSGSLLYKTLHTYEQALGIQAIERNLEQA